MKPINKIIKKTLNSIGIELKRYNINSSQYLQTRKILTSQKIKTIIDVGANTGQFAEDMRFSGYSGKIISFEPQLDAHSKLIENGREDEKWFIADRMALGNRDGEIEINISKNSVSSSILNIEKSHTDAAPESAYIKKEIVKIKKLDNAISDFDIDENLLIKIDVQGYEEDVIKGALSTFEKTKCVQLEMSLIKLYDGQLPMEEIVKLLKNCGFELFSVFPAFIDESTGRTLQVDGIFTKPV